MEMRKINYKLEIDILRNFSQILLGVLRGAFSWFGCPKRHPDALLAKTMPPTGKYNLVHIAQATVVSIQLSFLWGRVISFLGTFKSFMTQYDIDIFLTIQNLGIIFNSSVSIPET